MTPEIEKLITDVEAATKIIDEAQPKLLAYCQNTNYSLATRWLVWEKFVEKKEKGWIEHNGLIGEYVEDKCDNFDRYAEYDYEYFVERFINRYLDDNNIDIPDNQEDEDKLINSIPIVNQLKEEILAANWGSMIYDW